MLGFIESVDFIDENDEPFLKEGMGFHVANCFFEIGHSLKYRAEGEKVGIKGFCIQAGEGRFAASGGAPEKNGKGFAG